MAEMSENMKAIMSKVRKHIMTGNSATTPAFDLRSKKAAPAAPKAEEPQQPPKKQAPKASAFKFPDSDGRDE